MSDELQYKGPEYPTQAHGAIPAFNSYEEEANFWDTHSITDLTHETKAVKVSATRGFTAHDSNGGNKIWETRVRY